MPKKKEPLRPEHIAAMRELLAEYRAHVTNRPYALPPQVISYWSETLVSAFLGNAEFFLDAADAQLKERT